MTQAARALPTDARRPEGVRWADGVRWAVTEAVTLASWWRKPRDDATTFSKRSAVVSPDR